LKPFSDRQLATGEIIFCLVFLWQAFPLQLSARLASLLFCPSYIHIFCRRPERYIHIWQIVSDRNRNAGNGNSSKKAFQVGIIDLLGSRTLQPRARSSLYWVLQQFIMADCVLPDIITGILDYGNRQGDKDPKLLLKQFPPCTTFNSRRRQGKEILRNLCPMMIDMLLLSATDCLKAVSDYWCAGVPPTRKW
jgi:hypothetical protein